MTCRDVIELLDRYMEDTLSTGERAAFETHIAGCAACDSYVDSYERTAKAGKAAFEDDDEIPDELVEAILDALRKRNQD